MHVKLKGHYLNLHRQNIQLSKLLDFTSMKSVKNMDSYKNRIRLCCFAFMLKEISKYEKDSESSENSLDQFQHHFACSHLSTILNGILEADHLLSCLSQTTMIVTFVWSMNKILFGKRLASVCSVSVDDVPDVVSGWKRLK